MNARFRLRLVLLIGGALSLAAIACGGDTGKPNGGPTTGSGGSAGATSTTSSGGSTATTGSGGGSTGGATSGGTGTGTGGAGTGGTGTGTGGSAGSPPMVDCTKDSGVVVDMIADFEMASGKINDARGRNGSFFTYNDLTPAGVQDPRAGDASPVEIPGGRCMSKWAMHVTAKGFTTWGAGFGTDLAYGIAPDGGMLVIDGGSARGSYDASAYTGISFWARVEPGSKPGIRINVADSTTAPEGGKCVLDNTSPNRCYDDFGQSLGITSTWDYFKIPFSATTQSGFGLKGVAIDRAHLYGIQFQAPASVDYNVWLDDLAFYK
jgi:hypothetical protein